MQKKQKMIKQAISLILLGSTSSLMAMQGEMAYLYKDPRIMGMGGANVAVGSYSTSVFSNPAGLATISKEDGFVVDLLGIGVSMTDGVQDVIDDIDKADTDAQMSEVLTKYSGEHFHSGVDNYTAVSKNSDAFAWSVGLLAASDVNIMTHANGGPNGVLETSSRIYGGIVLGIAKPFETDFGRFDLGLGAKYITQQSYEGTLGITDLTGDADLEDKLKDKYEKEASALGFDLGVTYHPFSGDSYWNPAFGLSILNIGSLDMEGQYGEQPMTVNLGASVSPDVGFLEKLVIAVDYVDMLSENQTRLYDLTNRTGTNNYTDYDDEDLMKRLRLGVSMGLINSSFFSATLNGGMYQGAYTAGLDMDISVVKLDFATYEEDLGHGIYEKTDRRYMAKLGIGW